MIPLSLGKVVEFVSDNHPYAKTWEPELLASWVAFFMREELIVCATVDGRNINGLAMFRPVMDPENAVTNHYTLDYEGPYIFIDFVIAPGHEMRRGLIALAIQRLGQRKWVAWERHGTLRTYSTERYLRNFVRGEIYHGS